MKTGIVRQIDPLGRICIPKEMRRSAGMKEGDEVEICLEGTNIVIKPYEVRCACCDNPKWIELVERNGVYMCPACIKEMYVEVKNNEY